LALLEESERSNGYRRAYGMRGVAEAGEPALSKSVLQAEIISGVRCLPTSGE
jgi:hypothetical protein